MGENRVKDLKELQGQLYKRLQAVELRIKALENGGSPLAARTVPLIDKNSRIQQAAWELEDAIYDRRLPKEDNITRFPGELGEARSHHVHVMNASNNYNTAIVALIILTFVEVPPWCHERHGDNMNIWKFQSGAEWCPLPEVARQDSNPNLSGIMYLPPGYAFIIEMIIEWVIISKFWHEFTLEQKHFAPMGTSIRMPLSSLGFIFACGSIVDTGVFMLFRVPFRLTFIFRTGLIFLLPGVQHIFWQIFNRTVLTEFGSVAVFFLGTMVFFAWIGLTVFQGADTFSYMEGEEKVLASHGFESFFNAINTMFIGGVTGEFIDCFLPSFVVYRLSGIVWMIYLLLTQVLFKNLVMDTLISAYLKGKDEEEEIIVSCQISSMTSAFKLLSDDGELILKEDFLTFVKALATSPRWKPIPLEVLDMMYDEFEGITKANWVNMCALLQSEFWVTDLAAPYLKDKKDCEWITDAVWEEEGQISKFDVIMNWVLMFNLIMVLIESTYDLMEIPEPAILDTIEMTFSFVYVGEVAVKLVVKSFGEYWASLANKFDFFTTWLLLSTSMLKYLPFASVKTDLAKYANILRLLRLIRIIKQLKRYKQVQFMLRVITRIVSCAGEVLELTGTFFFFFCTLAVNLFGGLLHEGNEALEGSEYAEHHWYVLNFNDMLMAFMTWFVQIICEYVPNYSDALTRTGTAAGLAYGPYSGLVVLFFYITTAAIMYELLLAFTVDVFMAVLEEDEEEETDKEMLEEKEEEEIEKKEMEENESSSSSSSACSSSESEFEAEEFVAVMQEKVFTETEEQVHFRNKTESAFVDEFNEKYEQIILGHGAGRSPVERQVCKAAWLLENGFWNQRIYCDSKSAKLDSLRKEKEETEDEEAKKKIDMEIQELNFSMDIFPKDIEKAREDHVSMLQATQSFYKAIVCLVLLTFTEVPAWCHSSRSAHLTAWSWAPGWEWCRAPEPHADMNLSGIWYLPPGYAAIFEILIEVIVLRRFMVEYHMEKEHFMKLGERQGDVQYANLTNIYVGCICSIGSIIDTLVFAVYKDPFRFTFLFRTGLLCLLPGVQRLWVRIFNRQMLGQFFSVAVFFIGTVLFFSWIAVTIYKDATEVAFVMGGEDVLVGKGFEGLRPAVYTMFLAGMTEGFDDIFIPTVTSNRASAILWLCFLLLTQVLFLNLVIDAFVAAYLEGSEKNMTLTAHTQAMAAFHAATLLFDEECEKEVFLLFIAELNRSPRMRSFDPSVADAMYDQFVAEEDGLNIESWCDMCTLVQNQIWTTPRNSCLENKVPGIWNSDWFMAVRNKVWEPEDAPWFDEVMDTVLLFNLVFVVAQSLGTEATKYIPPWLHLSAFFTLIYVFEMAVKLSVKSWKTYWSYPANQFDFYTTWILFGTWSVQFINIASLQHDLMRYANLLRLLRLLRVAKKLKKYPRVQFMVTTVVRMVEAAGDILALLGVTLFFFTTFSVNFFGGLLYEGNPALEGSDYKEKHWFVFNFNDVIMGYVTWFTQLLCEYAPEWADALYRVSSIGWFAWYIYPIFYILGVAIVFEILQAFTIETYLALKEEADDESDSGSESGSEAGDAFEKENEVIEGVTSKLKKDNRSLHTKMSLLPALQIMISKAYAEAIEEEDAEREKAEKREARQASK
jgi:two pore calcium channel protein